MVQFLHKLYRDESGQSLTEYSLILAVVAIAAVAVLTLFGNKIKAVFDTVISKLNSGQTYNPQ